jgi:VWFA-related protein
VSAQDPSRPSFPVQAEAITVDVVVLDAAGQPVAGLDKDDFTLLDGGRPQPIVAFEARRMTTADTQSQPAEAGTERVASNVRSGRQPGRVLVVLVDDLGLTPPVAQQVGPALARWIRDEAEPTDEITIMTTSGDLWWSAEVASGRGDLLAVLDRLRGKRTLPPSTEWISEVEAYQIVVHGSPGEVDEAESSKGDRALVSIAGEEPVPPSRMGVSASVLDRVAMRFLEAKSCYLRRQGLAMLPCNTMARTRAEEVYGVWTRRARALLGLVERVSTDMAGMPGRKSILVVSEDLLRDVNLESRFRDVVRAAQRGNTALYFSRASGLTGPVYTASGGGTAHPSDVATLGAEQMQVAVGGGEHLADATGGASITTTNDLAAGLARMASDASSYYLLGYQPQRAPDGKWHRLEVKVRREGLEVRARRGYVALPPASAAAPDERAAGEGGSSPSHPVLPTLSAGTRDGIPLRVASYLQNPDGAGAARILVVIEVDGDRVRTTPLERGEVKARLDLGILAVSRDQPKVLPLTQTLELTLRPRDQGWWAVFRDVRLPPGVAQVRVHVRDAASGAQGSVAQRIEVPDVEAPYLSTPFLSDAMQPPRERGEPPQIVPTARRAFPTQGTLYCQYELFLFGGRDLPGVPRVTGSYTVARSTGEVVTSGPPTFITTDGTRVVRRLALPLEQLTPGAYDLLLTVEDHLANRTFTARERFAVAADVASGAPLRGRASPRTAPPAALGGP